MSRPDQGEMYLDDLACRNGKLMYKLMYSMPMDLQENFAIRDPSENEGPRYYFGEWKIYRCLEDKAYNYILKYTFMQKNTYKIILKYFF